MIDCSTGDCKDGLQHAISTLVNPNYPGGYGEYFGMLLRSSIMHHGNISEKVVYMITYINCTEANFVCYAEHYITFT